MSVFKRFRKDRDDDADDAVVDGQPATPDAVDAPVAEAAAPESRPSPAAPQGPWDVANAPEREAPRLDLGALLVPVGPGIEVRVDVSPQGDVVAATLVRGDTALQISAFAAPRTEGIWDEVREEIATALRGGGGQAQEAEGPFGTELQARVPTQVPEQGVVLAPARFLGVDGPRWFVRALITGAGAQDPARAAELEAAFRDVVVVRGSDPMVVRDPLLLRLPKDVADQAAQAAAEQGGGQQGGGQPAAPVPPPERGPEITEIR
jgi:hypothetical protein